MTLNSFVCKYFTVFSFLRNVFNYSRTPDERPPSPTTIPLIRPHFVWRTVVSVRIRIPHERPSLLYDHTRVRQIVCPVIPGTPKSVVGPLDILPGCSVGTLDLATSKGIGGISHLQVLFEDRPEQTQCCNDVWPCWQSYISGSPSHALIMICQGRTIIKTGDQIGFWESTIYAFWSE